MCHKAFSEDSFMLKYCLDRSKNCLIKLSILFLPAFRFVRNWFVSKKIIKKLSTALFADDNILFCILRIF